MSDTTNVANDVNVSFFLDDWSDIRVNTLKGGTMTVSIKSYPTMLTIFIKDKDAAATLADKLLDVANELYFSSIGQAASKAVPR